MKSASTYLSTTLAAIAGTLLTVLATPFNIFSATPALPDSILLATPVNAPAEVVVDSIATGSNGVTVTPIDSLPIVPLDTLTAVIPAGAEQFTHEIRFTFNPDPNRAVWLSALCPGLGQLYNRRYWKLPIVIGGFMGLGYATTWNNGMLRDYTRAYADIMDTDPNTRSYMDFFPPTVAEDDLDRTWLKNTLKARKDYYRRNRDLCVICMIGVYALAMIDAYVDASLAHFDISPDLSVNIAPALIEDPRSRIPGVGMHWALNF